MARAAFASGLSRLKQVSGLDTPTPPEMPEQIAIAKPPAATRAGLKQVAGHFELAVRQQLEMIGVLEDRTSQDLLAEALNDLFVKYDQSPIAKVYGKGSRSKPRAR